MENNKVGTEVFCGPTFILLIDFTAHCNWSLLIISHLIKFYYACSKNYTKRTQYSGIVKLKWADVDFSWKLLQGVNYLHFK